MNALELLKQQHREVETLFDRIEDEDDSRARKQLVSELAKTLRAHTTIEEKIFYPASQKTLTGDDEQEKRLLEFYEEHGLVATALDKLVNTQPSDDRFAARLKVLVELLNQHIEEEEHDLFPALEAEMGSDQLDRLGTQLERRFDAELEGGAQVRRGAAKGRRGPQPSRTTRAARGARGGTTARKATSRTGRRASSSGSKRASTGRKSSGR